MRSRGHLATLNQLANGAVCVHGRRHTRHAEEVFNDSCLKAIYPLR